jgi:hypothetical protein
MPVWRTLARRRKTADSPVARSACSQIRTTRQPLRRRARVTSRSRSLFRESLASQNFRRVAGMVPCLGQPCQKQPSTKTATRSAGQAKSGRPGRGRWRRQPVIPDLRRAEANRSSVARLPRERTAAITRDRSALVKTSAMGRSGGQTPPIHWRSSQTALSEVRLRRSNTRFAAEISRPCLASFHASLALMATNWRTLGSR